MRTLYDIVNDPANPANQRPKRRLVDVVALPDAMVVEGAYLPDAVDALLSFHHKAGRTIVRVDERTERGVWVWEVWEDA